MLTQNRTLGYSLVNLRVAKLGSLLDIQGDIASFVFLFVSNVWRHGDGMSKQ